MKATNQLTRSQRNTVVAFSLPLIFLIIIASSAGLLIPGTYFRETLNWTSQSLGQDVIDLFFITPVLIITTILTAKKNKIALSIWGGTNLYLIYTYVIYSFDIHFNRLFIVYCMILGLSFYSFLYFLFLNINRTIKDDIYNKAVVKIIAFYFIAISGLFYLLWLSKIIPTIFNHAVPQELIDAGLTTNPVHVLDLAVILPGFLLISLFLFKKSSYGLLFTPVLLVFSILMDITIGGLIIIMKISGVDASYFITAIMGCLALFSLILLILFFKGLKE